MVDLRSDTISMPTRPMLESILTAQLGDDGRADANGRGEDATANRLEDLAAALTGKEAAVLFSTGTQGNTAALFTWCRPGDRVMVDEQQHIYLTEKVAFDPAVGQMIPVTYRLAKDSTPDLDDMERILTAGDIRLVCVENSHNFSGGTCVSPEKLAAIRTLAKRYDLPVHMDGARLFNAAISLGVPAAELCKHVDSVMFCISKGLGAPIGSLVCGSAEFVRKLRGTRKLLGGAMRQAGVIAAPGIYALEHHIPQLGTDHANAAYAADALRGLRKTHVQERVMSNIIMLKPLGVSPEEYCRMAAGKGLLIRPVLKDRVRLVFYRDIDRAATEQAIRIIRELDQIL